MNGKRRGWLAGLGVFLGALIVGGTVAAMARDGDSHTQPYEQRELPPPAFNRWIRPNTGEFWVPEWDDRAIGVEQKAATPWYNPRWKPFSECIRQAGFSVRTDAAKPFGQADLDALLKRINQERPNAADNLTISDSRAVPGLAGAFLRCADEWLTVADEDLAKYGLKPLVPGEVPDP